MPQLIAVLLECSDVGRSDRYHRKTNERPVRGTHRAKLNDWDRGAFASLNDCHRRLPVLARAIRHIFEERIASKACLGIAARDHRFRPRYRRSRRLRRRGPVARSIRADHKLQPFQTRRQPQDDAEFVSLRVAPSPDHGEAVFVHGRMD